MHPKVAIGHMQDKNYTAAGQLAFELKQPGRLLAVVSKACEAGPTKAQHTLTQLVVELSQEELKLCVVKMQSESAIGHMQDKDYTAAAQLAFELKQPGRLLAVVSKACEAGPAKAQQSLTQLVGELTQEELKLCVEYIRDWNINSRHCNVAQAMLKAVLVRHPPQVSFRLSILWQLHLLRPKMLCYLCSSLSLLCYVPMETINSQRAGALSIGKACESLLSSLHLWAWAKMAKAWMWKVLCPLPSCRLVP